MEGRGTDGFQHILLCRFQLCVGSMQGRVHQLRPWQVCMVLPGSDFTLSCESGSMAESVVAHPLREEPLKDVGSSKLVQHPSVAVLLHQAPIKVQHNQDVPKHPAALRSRV